MYISVEKSNKSIFPDKVKRTQNAPLSVLKL